MVRQVTSTRAPPSGTKRKWRLMPIRSRKTEGDSFTRGQISSKILVLQETIKHSDVLRARDRGGLNSLAMSFSEKSVFLAGTWRRLFSWNLAGGEPGGRGAPRAGWSITAGAMRKIKCPDAPLSSAPVAKSNAEVL